MNINEHYGCLDLPSEIVDSFDHQDTLNNLYYKNSNKMNEALNKSEYVDDFNQKIYGFEEMESGIGLDSSVEDTFLANLPVIVGDKQINRAVNDSNNVEICVSKTKIIRNALPSEELTEYIQIINSCSNSVILNIMCPIQIEILSSECYQRPNNFENNIKEFYLDAWQKIEVGFKIKKDDEEFGDVFETITIDYRAKENKNTNGLPIERKKKTYIEVEVHYITPKMAITYEGCSDVTTISLNKVSMNKIGKNKFGEYCLNVGVVGVERLECTIETRGNLKVFPNELILYKDEKNKITFKPTSNAGALIMKAKNAKVCFVFGVELI